MNQTGVRCMAAGLPLRSKSRSSVAVCIKPERSTGRGQTRPPAHSALLICAFQASALPPLPPATFPKDFKGSAFCEDVQMPAVFSRFPWRRHTLRPLDHLPFGTSRCLGDALPGCSASPTSAHPCFGFFLHSWEALGMV